MTVFEKMLEDKTRQAFLERKRASYTITEEELELLKAYILSEACTADIRRLNTGDYFLGIPEMTRLRKGHSDKRRIIYRFSERERSLMKYIAFVMHDEDDLFSDSLYSFRIGKRVSEIFYRLSDLHYAETDWVIKADITGFGDHVDPGILCGQLEAVYKEKDPMLLLFFKRLLLRGEYYEKGELKKGSTGALSGCALTSFFENVYLLDVDEEVRARSDFYCRFADDIAIFVKSREEAEGLLADLTQVFSERGLTFNERKTMIVPAGGRFELLGFNIEGAEYDIAESSVDKITGKLRYRAKKLVRMTQRGRITKEEAARRMVKRINSYFFERYREEHELNWVEWAFKVITRPDSLKKLDEAAQDCIRFAGSGGKNGNAKYRIRYKQMKVMGYRTLVHAWYHRDELRDAQSGVKCASPLTT